MVTPHLIAAELDQRIEFVKRTFRTWSCSEQLALPGGYTPNFVNTFSNLPYHGDDKLVYDDSTSSSEVVATKERSRGRRWKELSIDSQHRSKITLLGTWLQHTRAC